MCELAVVQRIIAQPCSGIVVARCPRARANCSARYYDLNKTPITCPKRGTPFEVVPVTTRPRPDQRTAARKAEVETEDAKGASLFGITPPKPGALTRFYIDGSIDCGPTDPYAHADFLRGETMLDSKAVRACAELLAETIGLLDQQIERAEELLGADRAHLFLRAIDAHVADKLHASLQLQGNQS